MTSKEREDTKTCLWFMTNKEAVNYSRIINNNFGEDIRAYVSYTLVILNRNLTKHEYKKIFGE